MKKLVVFVLMVILITSVFIVQLSAQNVVRRDFLETGNHTFTYNERFPAMIEVYVLGAGGGGQGGHSKAYQQGLGTRTEHGTGASGGGGAAAYIRVNATSSVTFNITVGAGGAGSARHNRGVGGSWESASPGSAGGDTTVRFGSTTITAQGGRGGAVSGAQSVVGGAGGRAGTAPGGHAGWASESGSNGSDGRHNADLRVSNRGGNAGRITGNGTESSFGGGTGHTNSVGVQRGGGGGGGYGNEAGTAGGHGRVLIIITPLSPSEDIGVVINGVRWATRNVDHRSFASRPEDSGSYMYMWDGEMGGTPERNGLGPLMGNYAWETYVRILGWGSYHRGEVWRPENDPSPPGWRLPTEHEIRSLLDKDKVSSEWMTLNGVQGRRYTDIATGATIFLPAAGKISYDVRTASGIPMNYFLNEKNEAGYYWSSSTNTGPNANDFTAYALWFNRNEEYATNWDQYKTFMYFIRPVWATADTSVRPGRPYINVPAQTATSNQIQVNWPAVTGADRYNVYFSTSSSNTRNMTLAGTVTGTSFTHTGLRSGTQYYYSVTALNRSGESDYSAVAVRDTLGN